MTFIIFLMCYGEEVNVLPTRYSGSEFIRCLFLPFVFGAVGIIFWQLFHSQPEPRKFRWFGFATISLLMLVSSPILSLLLANLGNNTFAGLVESLNISMWLDFGYWCLVVFMLVFILTLGHQPFHRIKRFIIGISGTGIFFATRSYLIALNGIHHEEDWTGPALASLLLGGFVFLIFMDLMRQPRARFWRGSLAILVTLWVAWSPYIGSTAVFQACNIIHQWQLEPVIVGIGQYKKDSGRYPLAVRALTPYYVAEPPRLLCFGGVNNYYLHSCENSTILLLRTQKDYSRWRLNLAGSHQWTYISPDSKGCEGLN